MTHPVLVGFIVVLWVVVAPWMAWMVAIVLRAFATKSWRVFSECWELWIEIWVAAWDALRGRDA